MELAGSHHGEESISGRTARCRIQGEERSAEPGPGKPKATLATTVTMVTVC